MDVKKDEKLDGRIRVSPAEWSDDDAQQALNRIKGFQNVLIEEMRKVIVGQESVIELIMIAILCKGHVLLEGVPGLGKTLMFRTLSKVMNLKFQHVQFTPDLMPSDILGTEIIQTETETGRRELAFLPGPVFCNFLLADEINRTSPKTQSALLQSMQDHEVTIGKKTYVLEQPFIVLATQNPIDQEGVYPLPEAQLDRFMFNVHITYPTYEEEVKIAERFTQSHFTEVQKVVSAEDILKMQVLVKGMLISDGVLRYAVDLVVNTRPGPANPHRFVNDWIEWGAGPRASLNLVLAAKARALLKGKLCVTSDDIRAVAPSVLRHRIKMNFSAEAEDVTTLDIVQKLVSEVPDQKK